MLRKRRSTCGEHSSRALWATAPILLDGSNAQGGHGGRLAGDVNARRDTVIEVIDVKPCHPKPAEPTKLIREFGSGKHVG